MQSLEVGKCYFIRTLVWYYTGRVVRVTPTDVTLEDAAAIPDQGRMYDALSTGRLIEVEPFPDAVILNEHVIVDATLWRHPLPRQQV